ncbi:MAG TPA: tyrosine-type recombinase/integrase [Gemmata sp.]|jgi:hypothetical protein|nr:tyrosine-type recombinase/integrase [Gemmata sp.]
MPLDNVEELGHQAYIWGWALVNAAVRADRARLVAGGGPVLVQGAPVGFGQLGDKPIWPGQWKAFGSELMRVDLAAAGIPYGIETVNGKAYADFHALRHTYSSALAAVGTGTKELQTLVRHTDPRLTLNTYTHVGNQALNEAVDRLRMPGKATGSPLAKMKREELEGVALGLLVILGTLLSLPNMGGQSPDRDTPRDTPQRGIPGEFRAHLVTIPLKRKRG